MSRLTDPLTRLLLPSPERNVAYIVGASVLATIAILNISRIAIKGNQQKIIRSPRDTVLPGLTKSQIAELPYPPDVLPEGRDVVSPYGTIRVYEWGPEEGRKVVLVHGISTPCISLGAMAHGLVEKGCRVMVFDLWGRGYSDCCADLEHDDRLYSTQILIAISSSKLSWTGAKAFSLVGYSLGGGISVSFSSYFSSMIESLVLVAPSGLIRPEHMSGRSKFLYSMDLVPESLLQFLVKKRLKSGPMISKKPLKTDVGDVVEAEAKSQEDGQVHSNNLYAANSTTVLSKSHPDITVASSVKWQVDANEGFVHAFMSSIRFAPITGRHESWERLRIREDKILIFAGANDPIIKASELKEDVESILGADKVDFRELPGGHDLPFTHTEQVLEGIIKVWKL